MLTRFIGVIILYYIQMIIYYHAIQIIVQMYKSLCCTPVTNMLLYVTYFNVLKSELERQEVSLGECSAWRGRGD